tara:strand:- start:2070 stop:2315 length:246 start_codon:yes stop_codon:yes gene_type:complete
MNQMQRAGSSNSLTIEALLEAIASPIQDAWDYVALTYVAVGNGEGQIETATYKTGGSGGTTVITLTLTYDASDRIASLTAA